MHFDEDENWKSGPGFVFHQLEFGKKRHKNSNLDKVALVFTQLLCMKLGICLDWTIVQARGTQ